MGMVVRTNIMANNAFRQLNMNNSQVGKSLEKLSSGFRINRAGDDASGLAISEKMKAQIKGLETASSNSQDGISLIQTAEGALTEVHDMLNRMVELAGKAANGTMDNPVDRKALQEEMDALKDDINRIAAGTNFNGIKLLDGSLGGGTSGGAAGVPALGGSGLGDLSDTDATAGKSVIAKAAFTSITSNLAKDDTLTYSITIDNGGSAKTYDIQLTVSENGKRFMYNGKDVSGADFAAGDGKPTDEEQAKALANALKEHAEIKGMFKVTETGGAITLENKVKGSDQAKVLVIEAHGDADADATTTKTTAATVTDGTDKFQSSLPIQDEVFTVGGQKFMFAKDEDVAKKADPSVNVVVGAPNVEDAAKKMAALIKQKTGYEPTVNGTNGFQWKADAAGAKAGKGLTLQIGDTSDSFNKLTVSINDMSANGLGIAGISVADQDSASAALASLRDANGGGAINVVSAQRAKLGALQNRLEHTINNLDVAAENMTSANMRIRDTDMAKEMMAYTKMNVLTQAAQAMLAQANQQPQSVLQLLQ